MSSIIDIVALDIIILFFAWVFRRVFDMLKPVKITDMDEVMENLPEIKEGTADMTIISVKNVDIGEIAVLYYNGNIYTQDNKGIIKACKEKLAENKDKISVTFSYFVDCNKKGKNIIFITKLLSIGGIKVVNEG